jgi:hypothetical protein
MPNKPPVSARRQPFAKRLLIRVFGASDDGRGSFVEVDTGRFASASPDGLGEALRTQLNQCGLFSMAGETPAPPIFVWLAVRPHFDSRDARLEIDSNNPQLEHIPTPPSHPAHRTEIPQPGPQGCRPQGAWASPACGVRIIFHQARTYRSKSLGGTTTLLDLPLDPFSHTQPHAPLLTMN